MPSFSRPIKRCSALRANAGKNRSAGVAFHRRLFRAAAVKRGTQVGGRGFFGNRGVGWGVGMGWG